MPLLLNNTITNDSPHDDNNDDDNGNDTGGLGLVPMVVLGYYYYVNMILNNIILSPVTMAPPVDFLEILGIVEGFQQGAIKRNKTIPRQRIPVTSLFNSLGTYYVRRAYRMDVKAFYALHAVLFPYMDYRQFIKKPVSTMKGPRKRRIGARNGRVSSTAALSCAIRYFAGGSVYDIACSHGIAVRSVYRCVTMVVKAINRCTELKIEIPEDHNEQRRLARGFQEKSAAGFDCCLGAIDGFLVWIEQPTKKEATDVAKCSGSLKFMCGRKNKYGLNMMGTVDYLGRFIDVEISHPGSTSDYLAFETSDLKWDKLEKKGFLAPGLVLFGDNAYTNSHYLVTPFRGSTGKVAEKDNFNFYHSQLRIQVECTFGMMVHRWGVLRRPISRTIGLIGACDMVLALCRLHNFCINARIEDTDLPPLLAGDKAYSDSICAGVEFEDFATNTATGMQAAEAGVRRPVGLLDGGDHLGEETAELRRQNVRRCERKKFNGKTKPLPQQVLFRSVCTHIQEEKNKNVLPQQLLYESVCNQGLERPTPKGWS